jgi:(4S)-4-hydroxy-5-phosphonooxypentane-2,3-dione isomerase
MSKSALIGTIEVQPGTRDEVLRAALAHRERCLRDEPGTLAFEVLVPVEDATKLWFYELYADPAAVDAHAKGKSMAQLKSEIGSKVVSLSAIQCTPAAEAQA